MYRTDARTRRLPRNAGRWYTLTAVARRLCRGRNADPPEWDADDDETEHHARRGPILTVPLERWYDGREVEDAMSGADPVLVTAAEKARAAKERARKWW